MLETTGLFNGMVGWVYTKVMFWIGFLQWIKKLHPLTNGKEKVEFLLLAHLGLLVKGECANQQCKLGAKTLHCVFFCYVIHSVCDIIGS
jgi:hypothetical protein